MTKTIEISFEVDRRIHKALQEIQKSRRDDSIEDAARFCLLMGVHRILNIDGGNQ